MLYHKQLDSAQGEKAVWNWHCNAGINQIPGVTLDSLHAQESQVVPKALVQGLLIIIIRFLGGEERKTGVSLLCP